MTIITGSFDTGRLAASTSIKVEGAVTMLALPGDLDRSGHFRHVTFRVGPVRPSGTSKPLTYTRISDRFVS
eukprot:COSAG05_NODE_1420_length_4927_cov_7.611226_5_plen_71_part_00